MTVWDFAFNIVTGLAMVVLISALAGCFFYDVRQLYTIRRRRRKPEVAEQD